jgi:SAM-dependent methyltransferase
MLNTLINTNNICYYPQAKTNIVFTGGLCNIASRNLEAKSGILQALGEYFEGVDPKVFEELFEVKIFGQREFWTDLKRYLCGTPIVFNKVKENAQKVSANRIEFLKGMFQDAKQQCGVCGNSLIDIGSGDGKVTQELVNLFGINTENVLGIELKTLPEHEHLPFLTKIYTGENLAEQVEEKYDIASLVSTLHHSKDPEGLLRQAHKLLNDNGSLIIVENPPKNEADRIFHSFMDKFEYTIVENNESFPIANNFNSLEQWQKMLQRCGFNLIRVIEPPANINNPFRRVCFIAQKIPTQRINIAYQACALPSVR